MTAGKKTAKGLGESRRRYIAAGSSLSMGATATAKLFRNGRSQAVRLPKAFRFEGNEVYVKREGDSVVLSPKRKAKDNPWKDFFEALDSFDPAFPIRRHQPRQQQIRKSLDDLFRARSGRSKRSK